MKNHWKILLTWFIALIIFSLLINFFTVPYVKKILSAQSDIALLKTDYSNKKTYKDDLSEISKTGDYEEYTKKWLFIMPNNSDQADLFSVMLEELAKKDNIIVNTITFDKNAKKPTGLNLPKEIEAITYTFTGSGSYDNLIQFIKDTTKLSRINHYQHLTIKPEDDIFTLNLQGEIYQIKGSPKTEALTNFDYFIKLKEWTDLLINFTAPSATDLPVGKANPFQ